MTAHPERTLPPGGYWACEHPERPHDSLVSYRCSCRRCLIAAQVHSQMHGDFWIQWVNSDGSDDEILSVSAALARLEAP